MTQDCDEDVGRYCAVEKDRSRGVWSIGAVGRCLANQLALATHLNDECQDMIRAAAPAVSPTCLLPDRIASQVPDVIALQARVCTSQPGRLSGTLHRH